MRKSIVFALMLTIAAQGVWAYTPVTINPQQLMDHGPLMRQDVINGLIKITLRFRLIQPMNTFGTRIQMIVIT